MAVLRVRESGLRVRVKSLVRDLVGIFVVIDDIFIYFENGVF